MCAENKMEPRQLWTVNTDGTIALQQSSGLCLTANGHTAKGSVDVVVETCSQAANQIWTMESDGNIVLKQSGDCLDIQTSNTTFSSDGNLETYHCHPQSGTNQYFKFVNNRLLDTKQNFVIQAI